MATPPSIVNIIPAPDDPSTSLVDFVRFTLRDLETYIDAGQLFVTAGYASVRSDGEEEFEKGLNRTFRSSVLPGALDDDPPTIEVLPGVRITKTSSSPQRSVFFTSIDAGGGFDSVIVTGVFDPSVSADAQGAVLGLEHGRRNTGAYLFFDSPGGSPRLRLVGPADAAGTHVPDTPITYDWSAEVARYILVWNETRGLAEVYVVDSSSTALVASTSISSFQEYDLDLGIPTPRRGGASEITLVYGIEGDSGDSVTIDNIAVTKDVGFPIVGVSRPGEFLTHRRSDETIRYPGGDIRRLPVSPWHDPSTTVLPNVSASGEVTTPGGTKTRISKDEAGTTFAIWREEPGFQRSATEGILLEGNFFGIPTQLENERVTGMGFLIWDGTTAFLLMLLVDGVTRNVGLLRGGSPPLDRLSSYIVSPTPLEWGSPTYFRLTIDPRRGLIELFGEDDITFPLLSTVLDRAILPDATDMGFTTEPPFIAMGHLTETDTTGAFETDRISYSHLYQGYESRDGIEPDAADPSWIITAGGFGDLGPLYGFSLFGGGFGLTPLGYFVAGGTATGSASLGSDGELIVSTDPGETFVYYRDIDFGIERGAVLETRLWITEHKPRHRSGFFLILDDGLFSYMLSFVDTDIGKFVAIPVSAGLEGFVEKVGTEGEAASLSARVDWSQPHLYRLERRPLDGLYLFVDGEEVLFLADSENVDFPTTQLGGVRAGFGNFTAESGSVSLEFIRTMFGSGYEVAFRKVDPVLELEERIGNTQAIVVVSAEDLD